MKALVLIFLLAVSTAASPLPDSVYAEIAAGIPDGVLDLTTVPGPGEYELTDAKPGLVFNAFNNVTVLTAGVVLKPTENVVQPITINAGTRITASSADTRLQATGLITAGTTQLECQYTTGLPVVKLNPDQRLRTANAFALADPGGFSMCFWIWGDERTAPPLGDIVLKPGNTPGTASPELYIRGNSGFTELAMGSGVSAAGGGLAYVIASSITENGKWNFVALYFNQAGNQVGISINGGAFTTAATAGTWTAPTVPTNADIGGRSVRMSNVWLWKGRVLTLAEFQAIYNSGVGKRYADLSAGQKTNLLHAWEMNEVAGADREDSHGTIDLDEAVAGPIAQHLLGWTGTVNQPLTNVFSVGDRCIITCGVQIADAQEPKYSVFRGISAISGNTITFDEPFPIACENFGDSATMLALDADPLKVGAWGGDGDTLPYLHPFSPGTNSYGYMQRGWGTSHDLHLFAAGHPNAGLTIKDLTIDWSASTNKKNGTQGVYAGYVENVRFENLTLIKHRGYNGLLIDRCRNSGVDGYTMRGDATGAIFVDNTDYAVAACAIWSGETNYFRNLDFNGNGIILFNAEGGSINTVVENVRLTGGSLVPPQPHFGQHFGSYASHYQGSALAGVAFRNCSFDTSSDASTRIGYYTTSTAGFTITNMAYAGGEFSESTEFRRFQGYIRAGKRVFGPRTALNHNFSVTYDGASSKTVQMPVGLYVGWPTLTLDTRAGLAGVHLYGGNLFSFIPTGTVLSFNQPAMGGGMQNWDRGGHGSTLMTPEQLLPTHWITFGPSAPLTETRNYNFTAEYFPEVTSTIGPRTPVVASTGGVLRASNGKSIALVAAP